MYQFDLFCYSSNALNFYFFFYLRYFKLLLAIFCDFNDFLANLSFFQLNSHFCDNFFLLLVLFLFLYDKFNYFFFSYFRLVSASNSAKSFSVKLSPSLFSQEMQIL